MTMDSFENFLEALRFMRTIFPVLDMGTICLDRENRRMARVFHFIGPSGKPALSLTITSVDETPVKRPRRRRKARR